MGRIDGRTAWMATGILLLMTGSAWAAEAGTGGGGLVSVGMISIITGGFALSIAAAAAAIGQSRAIAAALNGIARQPSAAPRIQVALILGLAFIESLAIYVLLIAFIVLFAKPFGS